MCEESGDQQGQQVEANEDKIKVSAFSEVDGTRKKSRRKRDVTNIEIVDNFDDSYEKKKNLAEGMMDIALLSANSNQLRFILTYNTESSTFYVSLALIALSLTLQVCVGIALILKRKTARPLQIQQTNQFLVAGVFIITFINVLITAFTTTGGDEKDDD